MQGTGTERKGKNQVQLQTPVTFFHHMAHPNLVLSLSSGPQYKLKPPGSAIQNVAEVLLWEIYLLQTQPSFLGIVLLIMVLFKADQEKEQVNTFMKASQRLVGGTESN